MDCGSLLPLCCHSLLWSEGPTRQQAGGGRAAAGCTQSKVVVENPAKMIRAISRMKPSRLKLLRGPALIWKRRLEKRGRIASLVEE